MTGRSVDSVVGGQFATVLRHPRINKAQLFILPSGKFTVCSLTLKITNVYIVFQPLSGYVNLLGRK